MFLLWKRIGFSIPYCVVFLIFKNVQFGKIAVRKKRLHNKNLNFCFGCELMEFSNISLIMMYSLLWLFPLFRLLRCAFSLKRPYTTLSGRVFVVPDTKETLCREKLKEQKDFVEKYPKLDEIQYVEVENPQLVSSLGFSAFLKPQVIVVTPGLEDLSKPLYFWLMKRGVIHAHSKSQWINEGVMFLSEIGLILFLGDLCRLSFFIPFFLIFIVSRLIGIYYEHIANLKIDEAVMVHSSIEELDQGLCLLKAQLLCLSQEEDSLDLRKKWMKKSLNDRITCLSRAVGKENLNEDSEQVSKFYAFLKGSSTTEEAFVEAKKMKILRWIDADED